MGIKGKEGKIYNFVEDQKEIFYYIKSPNGDAEKMQRTGFTGKQKPQTSLIENNK